ncbi:restriction endonuclease subunit S [Capnocytophaga felis]|uniref:Type I restriction modification DNA specificity domain-containing protein n=1 Tax=Capnocytophaga felis TaxID=2267611 RepID=A0A5M4B778_9FLAO|nr:restriction endonuclease subunit S [Capnocytophaga felis]GET45454.1 hypothetical protein RCZ01_07560 [Capnocytophaga felis]GET47383.1 hypothetical protein RCZ02_02140 [Capnocytophaga felis]
MSEVLLSKVFENKDFRFDTDFWTKEPKINPSLKYMKIGDCLKISQYGISISMNEEERGIPIYRMNEIHNMLCDFSVSKYADTTEKELEIFRLNDRDVLFNRTNSFEWVGRTGIFYEQSKQDFIFASYLVRFVPNEEIILPEYLTTYLNTRYGIWDLKRRARQSINQTNINPEEVKESLIPILDKSFQLQIKSFFEISRDSLKLSQQKYTEAENLLLETLNLKDFQPTNESVNIKTLKESFLQTGRLDAEFYQKKYEEYFNIISKKDYSTIGKEYEQINDRVENFSEYNYIEIGDVNVSNGESKPNIVLAEDLPANAKIKAKKGDVLISKVRPYRGAVSIIEENYSNLVVSGAFTVLRPKNNSVYSAEFLKVLLRTELYKDWLLQFNVGTSYPVIKDEDILNLRIPIVSESVHLKIAEYIQKANQLRTEAQSLLQNAKLSVENAIESQLAENQNISGGG